MSLFQIFSISNKHKSTPNSQIRINNPRGDSVNKLFGSFLRLNFDILDSATNDR